MKVSASDLKVLNHFKNASELLAAIKVARGDAENEAIKSCGRKGVLRSRGMYVKVMNGPDIVAGESESWCYGGKAAEFEELANLLRYDKVTSVVIEGGFNWASSVRAMNDCDYDPWVSDWEVEVGRKGDFKFNAGGYYVELGSAGGEITTDHLNEVSARIEKD